MQDTTLADVPVRIYRPRDEQSNEKLPVMIYYHGGAYILGDLELYDDYLRELSKLTNIEIISVE